MHIWAVNMHNIQLHVFPKALLTMIVFVILFEGIVVWLHHTVPHCLDSQTQKHPGVLLGSQDFEMIFIEIKCR